MLGSGYFFLFLSILLFLSLFLTVSSAVYGQFVLFYIMCPLRSKYYANVGTQALGMYDTRIDCILKK